MKKYFFAGLATLLPLAITLWIAALVINFLTHPFLGLVSSAISHFVSLTPQATRALSQLFILISLFVFILLLGFTARRFFFHHLLQFGDEIIKRIPLVSTVYKTSKEIVNSLFGENRAPFKQAVLLRFPSEEIYGIGIISSDAPPSCQEKNEELISVFIPSTPNPTTGFLIMAHKKDLTYLKMSSEEAIKYIVSCAVIQPGENPK